VKRQGASRSATLCLVARLKSLGIRLPVTLASRVRAAASFEQGERLGDPLIKVRKRRGRDSL